MAKEIHHTEAGGKVNIFYRRLDFYWQFSAIYLVAIIVYAFLRGSISEGTFTIVIADPVVILLGAFIVCIAIVMLFQYYKKNTIIIGKDYITFKSRFREKNYTQNEITRIAIGREKITKIHGVSRVIKIRLNTRRRVVRIRPSSFWNERLLVQSVVNLKKAINK